ncbi:MAG TPA: biotin/lipoyl-binding protein, partial [Gaiellaceae bacterium]|nr:biotin/lipoyl-binding protein [Gaiellaceae bacterium]
MSAITSKLPAGLRRDAARRNRLLNILLALLLVIAGVVAYLAVGQSSSTSSGAVRTATVGKGVVLSSVSATGTVQAPQQVTANFTTSGTLVQVDVKPGETVQAGQPLGSIDSTSAQQQVSQAESGVETANAQLQLTLTGEMPQQRAQDALSVAQARQSLANARTALTAARRSVALDKLTTASSLGQAQRQLRTDQGQLQVDLAKQKADSSTYATSDAAAGAVTADKSKLAADQAKQQQDQQSQLVWQQQQSSDQSSLSTAKANNDLAGITNYT